MTRQYIDWEISRHEDSKELILDRGTFIRLATVVRQTFTYFWGRLNPSRSRLVNKDKNWFRVTLLWGRQSVSQSDTWLLQLGRVAAVALITKTTIVVAVIWCRHTYLSIKHRIFFAWIWIPELAGNLGNLS